MKPGERSLPLGIRIFVAAILVLNVSLVAVAVMWAGTLQEYLGKYYQNSGVRPTGFALFAYRYYLHLWISFAVFTAAAYAAGFRFYFKSRLSVEKRIFFLQFIFFSSSLVMVIFFVVLLLGLLGMLG